MDEDQRMQVVWRELRLHDDETRLDEIENRLDGSVRWILRLQVAELLGVIAALAGVVAAMAG